MQCSRKAKQNDINLEQLLERKCKCNSSKMCGTTGTTGSEMQQPQVWTVPNVQNRIECPRRVRDELQG